MSAAEILEQIRRLPITEREDLVERIEAEFTAELSPAQIAELDRRAADALKYPQQGQPAHEVFNDIEQRWRTKQ